MSKIIKIQPKGIDVKIQSFQTFIFSQLTSIWGISESDYKCYGRAYRNQNDKGYIPEVFTGNSANGGKDYEEVLINDKVKVQSFFSLGENQKYEKHSMNANVSLIFMVNVQALKPNVQHRADEEIRRDVEIICQLPRYDFQLKAVHTGIDNVFEEYPGMRKNESIKYTDMHPLHCFRIEFNLLYNIYDC